MTSDWRGQLRHGTGNDNRQESSGAEDVTNGPQVLPHRDWVQVSDDLQTSGRQSPDGAVLSPSHKLFTTRYSSQQQSARRFRLVTYNILSDVAIKPGEYLYCPSQLRYMTSRHDRIITEIRNMQPHVVCFQVSLPLSLSVCVCLCASVYSVCHCRRSSFYSVGLS